MINHIISMLAAVMLVGGCQGIATAGHLPDGVAQAQMICGERDAVIANLGNKYGEARRGVGVNGSSIVEVWASEATGSWTIISTYPNGVSCVMAVGDGWQDDEVEPAGSPA